MFWLFVLIFLTAHMCGLLNCHIPSLKIFVIDMGCCVGQPQSSPKINNRCQNIGENCSLHLFIFFSPLETYDSPSRYYVMWKLKCFLLALLHSTPDSRCCCGWSGGSFNFLIGQMISRIKPRVHEAKTQRKTSLGWISLNFIETFLHVYRLSISLISSLSHEITPGLNLNL